MFKKLFSFWKLASNQRRSKGITRALLSMGLTPCTRGLLWFILIAMWLLLSLNVHSCSFFSENCSRAYFSHTVFLAFLGDLLLVCLNQSKYMIILYWLLCKSCIVLLKKIITGIVFHHLRV